MSLAASPRTARPSLNQVAVPLVGEFLLGMSVTLLGLYLASLLSDAAAASFGLVMQWLETLFVVFRILSIGLGVSLSQTLGARQLALARATARVALGANTWAGLLVAACLVLGAELTLRLLQVPAELWPLALPFMHWLAPGMVLEAYTLSLAAVLRAHLQVRATLFIVVAMHLSHGLLAVLLMRGVGDWPGLGLPGFAAAWLLSRALGLALHLWVWKRALQMVPHWRDWVQLPPGIALPVLRIGLPGAAQEWVYRVAFMASVAATASLGVAALATHSYTFQVLKYVVLISMAIGWASEIMVGRCVGAGRLREADSIVRKAVRNGMLASGSLVLLAALSAPWVLPLFTRDAAIQHAALLLLWCSVALELGRVFNLVVIGALRAAGDVYFPLRSSVWSMIFVLGLGSLLMGQRWGLPGVWLAYVLDECLRGGLMWWRWSLGRWRGLARRKLHGLRRGLA